MKRFTINIILLVLFSQAILAQDVITVESKSSDISDNLDLEAVASVFGESKNLEDFEKRLNDPEAQISNLDLNGDGYVDYLRVVENSEEQTILITIQAIIGKDLYQDVATIDVERDNSGKTHVQVVGDVYMYGSDYIIEPVYVYTPVVCTHFWGVHYRRYYSPYYWHYYPSYYNAWNPYPVYVYRDHVYVHVNRRHSYHYTTTRRSLTAARIGSSVRRNDYGRSNPSKSFSSRNGSAKNTHELNRQRGISRDATNVSGSRSTSTTTASGRSSDTRTVNSSSNASNPSTGRRVQSDWNGTTRSTGQSNQVKSNRSTTNRTTTTRQTPSRSSNSRSVQTRSSSSSSVNRSVQSRSSNSKSSGSRSVQSKSPSRSSGSSSSVKKSSSSKSSGQKSGNKSSSGSSRSGSSKSSSKRR